MGAMNWTKIWETKLMACQSETCVEASAGSPVSGSVTVANCRMKPSFAMMDPMTEAA
jgi:hypothetical protein